MRDDWKQAWKDEVDRAEKAETALRWLLLEGSVCLSDAYVEPVTVSFPSNDWLAVPAEFHDLVKKLLDA